MTQQINLYNPAFLRKREPVSGLNLAIAAGILLPVLVGASFILHAWASRQVAAAAANEAQLAELSQQLAALVKTRNEQKPDPALAAELEKAQFLVRARQDIADAVDAGFPEAGKGYSEYMRALTRQVSSGLWLTGLVIGESGRRMEIRGSMLSPDSLPQLVTRLQSEPVFKGHTFASLNIAPATEVAPPGATGASPAPSSTPAGAAGISNFWLASEGSSSFAAAKAPTAEQP